MAWLILCYKLLLTIFSVKNDSTPSKSNKISGCWSRAGEKGRKDSRNYIRITSPGYGCLSWWNGKSIYLDISIHLLSHTLVVYLVRSLLVCLDDLQQCFSTCDPWNYENGLVQSLIPFLHVMLYRALFEAFFNLKGAMEWLFEEIKYANVTKCAKELLLPFPYSYLDVCGFNAINK